MLLEDLYKSANADDVDAASDVDALVEIRRIRLRSGFREAGY